MDSHSNINIDINIFELFLYSLSRLYRKAWARYFYHSMKSVSLSVFRFEWERGGLGCAFAVSVWVESCGCLNAALALRDHIIWIWRKRPICICSKLWKLLHSSKIYFLSWTFPFPSLLFIFDIHSFRSLSFFFYFCSLIYTERLAHSTLLTWPFSRWKQMKILLRFNSTSSPSLTNSQMIFLIRN